MLCNVLTGALWKLFLAIYDDRVRIATDGRPWAPSPHQGLALGIATEQFKASVLRSLDYLPPGELTFADLGRAILASELRRSPDAVTSPRVIRDEFVTRGMATARELELDDPGASSAFLGPGPRRPRQQ